MFESNRTLPTLALVVLALLSLMAVETSETLTVEGKSPVMRLASALGSNTQPNASGMESFSISVTLDAR